MSFGCQLILRGTCIFCRETERVLTWSTCSDGGLGVCDLCSYALRHAWQKQRGELVAAASPALVRTYALVPRLPAGRVEEDVSAYEFVVDSEGSLPYAEWLKSDEDLTRWLATLGVVTWPETVRPAYLGYAGSADFSETKLAWSWGKALGFKSGYKFASFAELLATPTPDAGFYLGIKAAFESLLWRREVAPEGNKLCVFMREPAMRYLRSLEVSPNEETDDEAMVEVCHQAMSADELEVAEILKEARGKRRDAEIAKVAIEEAAAKSAGEKAEDSDSDDDEVASGFARTRGKIIPPEDK